MDSLVAGVDAWLDASTEPAVRQIVLLDGPAVLGWERWREVGQRYGLGLVTGLLSELMEAGAIPHQPVDALAHVLIGALDEAVMFIALAADPTRGRRGAAPTRLCRHVAAVMSRKWRPTTSAARFFYESDREWGLASRSCRRHRQQDRAPTLLWC
jgi:hypothetical protein